MDTGNKWNMHIKNSVLFSSIMAFCPLIDAGTIAAGLDNSWRPMGSITVGSAWTPAEKAQIIEVFPGLFQSYVPTQKTSNLFKGALFLGMHKSMNANYSAELGVSFATVSRVQVQGDIWQNADPDFNNLSYLYRKQYTQWAAQGKWLRSITSQVQGYISGAMGIGYNRAKGFINTPKIFQVLAEPPFRSHTQASLSYSIGAGIQYALHSNVSVLLGYDVTNWGANHLLSAESQPTNIQTLGSNRYYTNQAILGLSVVV